MRPFLLLAVLFTLVLVQCDEDPSVSYNYHVVFVNKASLGIIFEASRSGGVEVMQVLPGGLAHNTKKIEVGDELLTLNTIDVSTMAHQEVMKLLVSSPWPRILEFKPRMLWDRKTIGKEVELPSGGDSGDSKPIESSNAGLLRILEPEIMAQDINMLFGDFGTSGTFCTHRNISIGLPLGVCEPIRNADQIKGTLVLVDRGVCPMYTKVKHAWEAGAAGVVFINSDKTGIIVPTAGHFDTSMINIPVFMVEKNEGKSLFQLVLSSMVVGQVIAQKVTSSEGGKKEFDKW